MKKILCTLIASASLMLAGAAHAGVIGFDDVNTDGDFASLGEVTAYAGLNWGEGWFAGDSSIDGYANGAHSGANYAVNGYGDDDAISIGSATLFNFAGAWFAAPEGASEKASWVNISAYDNANQLIGSTGQQVIGAAYTFVTANFSGAARLNITRDTGWFVMDDLVVSNGTVPEPGSIALVGLGMVALGWMRRRTSKRD